ncbi:MAG: lipid-A-disaccharide synthase [Flavobacteriales bacterium]|nr:lipid-A-disaccharide synthase [Flavobacteriales bacterium]
MRYYVISGEASGDLHGSNLIKQLKMKDPQAKIRAWGGDLMEAAGANVVKHYRDLAFMGFAEVIANLRTILRNLKNCKKDVLQFEPDVLILIDYPGFNLRMAEFAHKEGIKVFYYISPQIWAWKQNRVKKIKAFVDEMFVILPFEKDFYAKFGMDVHFVGHPLIDAVDQFRKGLENTQSSLVNEISAQKPLVVLMPGSRKQEISKMLPLMLKLVEKNSDFQFVVAGAPGQDQQFYSEFLNDSGVDLVFGKTYYLLSKAHAALVTSGTATLETAIFKVPQVVCYRGGSISYVIAKNLVKIKYISLVNLIMDREVVKELIQNELNLTNLEKEFLKVAKEGVDRENLLGLYQELYTKLGGTGASELTADLMLKSLDP